MAYWHQRNDKESILKAQDRIDLVGWRRRLSKVYGFGTIGRVILVHLPHGHSELANNLGFLVYGPAGKALSKLVGTVLVAYSL